MKKTILLFALFSSIAFFSQNYYKAKNDITYKVGDTLILSKAFMENGYKSIIQKPIGLSTNLNKAPAGLDGQKFIIKKINFYPNNEAVFDCSFKNAGRWLLSINQAIDLKEIVNPNEKLSKDEAIKLVEEKKKLLDLNLIKQEEYDAFLKEMKPFIIN